MKSFKLILLAFYAILFLNQTTSQAQPKRYLTSEDYKLWSEFSASNISADGNWVYCSLSYKATDTLFLLNKKNNIKQSFTKSYNASFSPNSKWFGFIKKDSLYLLNLDTAKKLLVSTAVKEYEYANESNYLIAKVQTNETKSLQIIDLKTFKTQIISDVIEYAFSPDKTKIAIVTKQEETNKVSLYSINSFKVEKVIASDMELEFKGLQWDDSSKKLAFFKEIKDASLPYVNHKIYGCSNLDAKLNTQELDPYTNPTFPQNSYIPISRLYVSAKTNQVFFDYKQIPNPKEESKNKEAVQIWLSEDLTIPPIDKKEQANNATTWTSWDTSQQLVVSVEDDEHKNAVLTGNDDNVLLYSFTELTPFYKYGGEYIAIYIKNLKKGTKTLLSSKQTRIENQVIVSPSGKYVNYFKDKNWWVYDIELQQHKCITIGMPNPLHRLDYDRPDLIPPYGSPGWTENDNNIIIYDQFDIWVMKPDGTGRKRLTNGRPTGTIFRLNPEESKQLPRDSFHGFQTQVFDFNKKVLLTTQNSATLANGYAIYSNGSGKQLFKKESVVHLIATSKNEKDYLFQESNFELAPRLFTVNSDGKETEIKQSNTHQKVFFWGKSSLINYKIKENKDLKGALFYPANYDSNKKYPMLVVIYEKKSQEVFDYSVPSAYSDHGFNNTNYTTEGYFVLYPDIAYGINTTGDDALVCVMAAVDEALKNASIDKNAMALIGHSFGGYETAYIMGHTNIFKTAIIGAPMIDLVSAYLTLDGHGTSNMWRFEFDQFRMLTTYDSAVFEINSPLKSAKNITAPLLLWTGTADKQLDWKHSMKLQSALWRMGKKSTMLVYPNEEHVLTQKNNQLDLTVKCKDWLDFYLKNQPKKEWMGKQ
jgi:dipeptidyl aminopeptidase/acylaminoacyl peptidase